MKRMIIITLLLAALSYGSTLSTQPFGLNLDKNVTIVDLWDNLGSPDSLGILGDSSTGNLIYGKGNVFCYLLITDLYSIEIKEGKFEGIEIGMKMSKIIRKLRKFGKVTKENLPSRQFLEYRYGNSNYILSLEFKKKRLTRIHIFKKI